MFPGGSRIIIYMIYEDMFPGLGLYYADPAQPLTTAHEELDDLDSDLDGDLCDLSVRGVKNCTWRFVRYTWVPKKRKAVKRCEGGGQEEDLRRYQVHNYHTKG